MSRETILRHNRFEKKIDDQIVSLAKSTGKSISDTYRSMFLKGWALNGMKKTLITWRNSYEIQLK
jgi:hypothetical protein